MFPSSNSKDRVFSGQRCIGATPAGNDNSKYFKQYIFCTKLNYIFCDIIYMKGEKYGQIYFGTYITCKK